MPPSDAVKCLIATMLLAALVPPAVAADLFHVFDLDISGTQHPGDAYGVLARLAAPL